MLLQSKNCNKKKDNKVHIVIYLTVSSVLAFLKIAIDLLFSFNNNLNIYLLSYFYKELPIYIGIVIFLTFIFIYNEPNKKNAYKKFIKKTLLISIIPFFIIEVIKSPENVKVDGKHTNLLNYQYNILKDVIENKTITVKINTSNIEAENTLYHSTTRNRKTKPKSEIDYCYVTYKKSNNTKHDYMSAESSRVVSIIHRLTGLENEITIEYYSNTGIIKAIDGINKTEYKKLKERIDYLEKQKNEQLQN